MPTDGLGFAAAANETLRAVEGAVFLLFCHDDVSPDPDAVRVMVEEAYRSNAGIVGPKIVDHDHPDILLEVGMAVDHYGVPFSGIEPDEVDQEQHDAVRDVFFVSHAMMLVRADLFHELSGFDAATFPGADDVDLCWRARLAGARVIVAPSARVRHRRATVAEARSRRTTPPSDVRDQTRSRVRLVTKSYSPLALVWVLPCAFVLSVAEALGFVVTGRARLGGAVIAGWFAAFAHPGELRRARKATQEHRRVDDGDVRDLMIHGSARLRMFVLQRVHAGDRIAEVGTRTRARMQEVTGQLRRAPAIVGTILGVLVVFGSRLLLLDRVPEVGGLRGVAGHRRRVGAFTGAWRSTFMGAGVAATPVFGLMTAFETALVGHGGLARSLVVGGALPLGAWGAYRLARSIASSTPAGVGAAVAYAANPIARNAVWQGELGPLVCFALAPFVFAALVRATHEGSTRRSRVHAVLSVALLVAVCASVWPPGLLLALVFAIAFVVAVPFARDARFAIRALASAALATALAVVLTTPWVWSLVGADAATLGFQPRTPLSLGSMLQFHTARAGAGLAPWGILAAAAVPLAIASGPRFAWATRAWTLAVLSFAAAWLPGRISPGASVPAPDGLLVGAALGLALAAGVGVAAVFDDLRQFHFGWRQVMTVVAAAGLGVAMLGLAADTPSGRWGLGSDDWAATYSWMSDQVPPGGFRVLWIGDPTILPADAKVVGDTGFALDAQRDRRRARAVGRARAAGRPRVLGARSPPRRRGRPSRLGHLLAPAGVRYIAFVTRAAPDSGARGRGQEGVGDALARQLDLTLSHVDATGVVYENEAWFPAARARAARLDQRARRRGRSGGRGAAHRTRRRPGRTGLRRAHRRHRSRNTLVVGGGQPRMAARRATATRSPAATRSAGRTRSRSTRRAASRCTTTAAWRARRSASSRCSCGSAPRRRGSQRAAACGSSR